MRPNVDSILALPKRKAQKLKISDAVHTDYLALFHVHLEFQFPLKIPLRTFQKLLCCSRTLCQYHNVIRIPLYFLYRLLCASVRTIAVTVIREQRFVDRNQLLCDCLLDDAVCGCWNSQRSYTAIRLGDLLPAHRLGLVLTLSDTFQKFL